MTTALTHTIALEGIEARCVDVQVQVRPGLATFQIVGLPDGAVREARERVQAAFHSAGVALPAKRIVVNLSPADLPKQGGHYDMPIAVALLAALGVIPLEHIADTLFMGGLNLDGSLAPVVGALPAAMYAQQKELAQVFVPSLNAAEASWAGGIVYGVDDLRALINHFNGEERCVPFDKNAASSTAQSTAQPTTRALFPDFADVKGQNTVRRAAEIAAAGRHHLLMSGPPGSGKSMVAKRLPGLLPPLTPQEALEVSLVHSVAGALPEGGLVRTRPFRDPHHSASAIALTGGGHQAKPGEMSLAHGGVLFLDELPEFPRQGLETLRQPLENGQITIARANHHLRYPAHFQLIAAMNPCPCGYKGHHTKTCTDTPTQVQKYQARLSGPLLDRFDLFVDVQALPIAELSMAPAGETTATMAARVAQAHQKQQVRNRGGVCPMPGVLQHSQHRVYNSMLEGQELVRVATPTTAGRILLDKAAEKFAFSARGYHRVLRVGRTIADLEGEKEVQKHHIAEALSFRKAVVG